MPLPQAQTPAVEHESASPGVHGLQAMPDGPQFVSERVVHAPCEQQPLAQDVESQVHAPAEQCSPAAHGAPVPHLQLPLASQVSAETALQLMHVAPAAPHSASDWVSHVVPLQQPPGHEVASQPSLVAASHPVQTHAPFVQLCPGGHERPPTQAGPRVP